MADKKGDGDKKQVPDRPLVSNSGLVDELGRPFADEPEQKSKGFNAADPKQIEAAKKEDGRVRRQDRDFYQVCMATPERRASFYRLLERCHIYATPADTMNTNRTYFNLGEENIGKQLMLSAMDASLDLYLTMLKESREVRTKERKNE